MRPQDPLNHDPSDSSLTTLEDSDANANEPHLNSVTLKKDVKAAAWVILASALGFLAIAAFAGRSRTDQVVSTPYGVYTLVRPQGLHAADGGFEVV